MGGCRVDIGAGGERREGRDEAREHRGCTEPRGRHRASGQVSGVAGEQDPVARSSQKCPRPALFACRGVSSVAPLGEIVFSGKPCSHDIRSVQPVYLARGWGGYCITPTEIDRRVGGRR